MRGGEQRRIEVGARQRASFLTRRGMSERSSRSERSEFRGATSIRAAQRSRRKAPTAPARRPRRTPPAARDGDHASHDRPRYASAMDDIVMGRNGQVARRAPPSAAGWN
ncbi:MAG: hypothetical protein MZW92_01850 [Comamonadaceae bacterium]|nr:hypothetical protein [Comamonadaceae bacterium]